MHHILVTQKIRLSWGTFLTLGDFDLQRWPGVFKETALLNFGSLFRIIGRLS